MSNPLGPVATQLRQIANQIDTDMVDSVSIVVLRKDGAFDGNVHIGSNGLVFSTLLSGQAQTVLGDVYGKLIGAVPAAKKARKRR